MEGPSNARDTNHIFNPYKHSYSAKKLRHCLGAGTHDSQEIVRISKQLLGHIFPRWRLVLGSFLELGAWMLDLHSRCGQECPPSVAMPSVLLRTKIPLIFGHSHAI